MTWYTEGPAGPEPLWLWLWLNEMGLPFQPHSWNNVFTAANRRCRTVLDPEPERRLDPHRSGAGTARAVSGAGTARAVSGAGLQTNAAVPSRVAPLSNSRGP
ncbi:hypothetical protein AMK21_16550 [Streptomyces sp. CB00316]|nr:hypothetical protein AMK21_16550 [Streptomyces sp. CB00316]